MRVLFVRHAAAADSATFRGADMDRPLTHAGRKKAQNVFKVLARLYPSPDVILSSQAVRACQTAQLLSEAFGGKVHVTSSALLNPGSNFTQFKKAVLPVKGANSGIAVVGHEPDFSSILGHVVGNGQLRVNVQKASCVEVDINSIGKGELKLFLNAAVLKDLGM
jgi:phosphohistidine phosphatase